MLRVAPVCYVLYSATVRIRISANQFKAHTRSGNCGAQGLNSQRMRSFVATPGPDLACSCFQTRPSKLISESNSPKPRHINVMAGTQHDQLVSER